MPKVWNQEFRRLAAVRRTARFCEPPLNVETGLLAETFRRGICQPTTGNPRSLRLRQAQIQRCPETAFGSAGRAERTAASMSSLRGIPCRASCSGVMRTAFSVGQTWEPKRSA